MIKNSFNKKIAILALLFLVIVLLIVRAIMRNEASKKCEYVPGSNSYKKRGEFLEQFLKKEKMNYKTLDECVDDNVKVFWK